MTARAPVLTALMVGLASGAILVPLNSTMLAVGLPGVMSEFGLGPSTVASLVTLYLGAVAIALPLSGALGDRFGHRRMFVAGVVGFGAASFIASIATSFGVLEIARVLQAACGALVSTTSTALVRESAPPERSGEAFGLFDLLVSTSAAVGPFVGGLLVGAFGWRSTFVIAIPLAVTAAVLVAVILRPAAPSASVAREPDHRVVHRLDIPGLVLMALAIVGVLVVLRTGLGGIGLPVALGTLVALGLLVIVELRTDRPAVDLRLLRRPSFAGALIGVFGATVVLHGCFLVVPLLVEEVLGGNARTSGLVLLGIAGVSAVVAPWGGRLSDRRGRRLVAVVGSAVTVAGLVGLWLPVGTASALAVGVLLGVVGLGMGLSGSPRQAAAFDGIAGDRIGMAAGTYYTSRYLGGVVGASLTGAVLGGAVTADGVSLAFGLLVVAGLGVTFASLVLPSRGSKSPLPTLEVDG